MSVGSMVKYFRNGKMTRKSVQYPNRNYQTTCLSRTGRITRFPIPIAAVPSLLQAKRATTTVRCRKYHTKSAIVRSGLESDVLSCSQGRRKVCSARKALTSGKVEDVAGVVLKHGNRIGGKVDLGGKIGAITVGVAEALSLINGGAF